MDLAGAAAGLCDLYFLTKGMAVPAEDEVANEKDDNAGYDRSEEEIESGHSSSEQDVPV
jgi:hypothetical protein